MNYLLVMPQITKDHDRWYQFPVGIAYVSASLKAYGKKVYTLNLNYKTGEIADLVIEQIKKHSIDAVGTGGLTTQLPAIREIIDAVKAYNPQIWTLVGGGIITSDPEAAMEALETADIGMIGEGDITICELADALEGKMKLSDVKALIYKQNGVWTKTEPRKEIEDLDALPYPDYEGFEFGQLMSKKPDALNPFYDTNVLQLVCSRSCPYNCTFCFHSSGKKYRQRSLDNIFEELDFLLSKYPIKNLYISDELFALKFERAEEFCRRIKPYNLPWFASFRVDIITDELVKLCKESNCTQIGLGLESADDGILKSMRKNITLAQIEKAMKIISENGVHATGTFIFGDLEETMETAMKTLNWWKAHPEYEIGLSLIKLYPGTYLHQVACARGIIKDRVQFIKDGCPAVNVSKLSDEEYAEISAKIDEYSVVQRDVLQNVTIIENKEGYVDFDFVCPVCGKVNHEQSIEAFRRMVVICSHCEESFNIAVSDYLDNSFEENIQKLLARSEKIVLWPRTAATYNMIQKAPSLQKESVLLVDKSRTKQQSLFLGKITYSPDVIAQQNIDTVVITIPTVVSTEIHKEIERKYPSVKYIYRAGELTVQDFFTKQDDELVK